MNFLIEQQLLQQIVNYLANRPWAEVDPMIQKLKELPKQEDTKKKSRDDD